MASPKYPHTSSGMPSWVRTNATAEKMAKGYSREAEVQSVRGKPLWMEKQRISDETGGLALLLKGDRTQGKSLKISKPHAPRL